MGSRKIILMQSNAPIGSWSKFDRATQNAVPCLVMGDFNIDPFTLPAGEKFRQQGCREAFEWHLSLEGTSLPPTCRNSTRHDTMLLHPALLPLWVRAEVHTSLHWFDSHSPLAVQFRLPQHRPTRVQWRLPVSWAEFGVDGHYLDQQFASVASTVDEVIQCAQTPDAVSEAFQTWAGALEDAASAAIASQHAADPVHQPFTSLPKRARGRRARRVPVQRQVPQITKPGRAGDFIPTEECTSILLDMRVRQVRTLQSLHQAMSSALSKGGHAYTAAVPQLQAEWRAVLRGKGYGRPFSDGSFALPTFVMFRLHCLTATGSVRWCSVQGLIVRHWPRRRRESAAPASTFSSNLIGSTKALPLCFLPLRVRPIHLFPTHRTQRALGLLH